MVFCTYSILFFLMIRWNCNIKHKMLIDKACGDGDEGMKYEKLEALLESFVREKKLKSSDAKVLRNELEKILDETMKTYSEENEGEKD